VLTECALLFASFAQLGTSQIADRFFPHFRNEDKKHNGFLGFLLLYPLIGFLLLCILLIIFKQSIIGFYQNKAPQLTQYFYFVLPLTFFTMYQNIMESYSRIHLRIVVPTITRELFLKLFNSLTIVLLAIHVIDLSGFVNLMILSYALAVVILFFYIRHLGKLFLTLNLTAFDHSTLKEMLTYGAYIILGGIGVLLATRIDVLMLPAYSGLNNTAVYVIATFMVTVIEIPKRSISQITIPLLSQASKENDTSKILELYQKTSLNQLLAGGFLFLGVWCNIDEIFNLIPKADIYREGKYVVLLLGVSKLIDMATGNNGEIILYSKFYRFALVSILLLAFMTIFSNRLLIPLYGINGAAIATALSIFIFTLVKFIFVWIKFGMQPYTAKTGVAMLIFISIYLTTRLLPHTESSVLTSFISILVTSTIITVMFFFLVFRFRVSEDVNKILTTSYAIIQQRLNKKSL
jgi:O-antigen/teichoic acid export membrane protein